MLRHYVKIAWRNLLRHKGMSSIHLAGFALGLTFTFVIGAYMLGEYQVNRNLRNIDRQYLIQSRWAKPDMGPELTTLAPLAEALKREYPQLVSAYYRWDGITAVVSRGNKHFREELQIGDTSFLNLFGFPLKEGEASQAFKEPFSAVITAEAAQRYFGSAPALGQSLSIANFSGEQQSFRVTAVMDHIPYNSVTGLSGEGQSQIFLSPAVIPFFGRASLSDWNNNVIPAYITIGENASVEQLGQAATALIRRHADPQIAANLRPLVLPLKTYYLDSNDGAVRSMLYTLFFISQFIFLMVLINFINMSVAGSAGRLREIGVRKVLGGAKSQLVQQFLSESVLLVSLSVLGALSLYQVTRPFFSGILGKTLPGLGAFSLQVYLMLALGTLFVGILAGLFPAFVLSSFHTIDSLKGRLRQVSGTSWLRRALLGFQFAVATAVLMAVWVVSGQVSLFFGTDLGYEKSLVVSAATPRDWTPEGVAKLKTARDEFKKLAQVADATLAYAIPDGRVGGSLSLTSARSDNPVLMPVVEADANYAATYGMPLAAGTFLKDHDEADGIVINESAARAFGWSTAGEAIGQPLRMSDEALFTVRGVIRDFHFNSMKEAIRPLCFISLDAAPRYRYLSFRLKGKDIPGAIRALSERWAALLPGAPFEYRFTDESLAELYRTELRLEKASYTAALLAVVIVLLGIVGLSAISIRKRMKEIGIRKVLGSSAFAISKLFVREFLLTALLACTLASPLAYGLLQGWLEHYSYRIQWTIWPFVVPPLFLLTLMVLLIFAQTHRAALTNSIKSLRTE